MNFELTKTVTVDKQLYDTDEGFQEFTCKQIAYELGSELFTRLDNKKHFYVAYPVVVETEVDSIRDRMNIEKRISIMELDDFLRFLERKGLINIKTCVLGGSVVSATEYLLLTRREQGE